MEMMVMWALQTIINIERTAAKAAEEDQIKYIL